MTDAQFYKSIGICPVCKKSKLWGTEKECPECAAKGYEYTMKSRARLGKEHYNKTHAEWAKLEHHKRIAQGMCTRCGKRKADCGFKTCGICRTKDNATRRKRMEPKIARSERFSIGLCYFCDNPIKDGYKVCEKHYQMNIEKANSDKTKETREKLKTSGYLF